jgi:GT2 family glycosyltransferase
VKIVQNSENGGFAKGYNDALQHIEAEVYCLLNSDVEVPKGWLDPIRQMFDQADAPDIVQPKILDLKKPSHFEYAGAAGGYIDQLGYPFCRGRVFQSLEADKGQYNDIKEVFWATGACMFIKSRVFHALGGFDEDYFAHQEEIDLCWRAKNQGHTVYYNGYSHVFHLGGSTLSNMNPRKTFLNFRNSLYSITKNLPRHKGFPIIAQRLLLDGIAGLRFLVRLQPMHCLAIIQAHFSYYRNYNKISRKREKRQFYGPYFATRSIVWSHFVQGVKNFSFLVKD